MNIINFGSLNFDKVYELPHFVTEGESLLSSGYASFLGGKGLNQSLALARAGASVYHLGAIGTDGAALRTCLKESNVDDRFLQTLDSVSGHAIIQNVNGLNCIIVFGGANQCVSEAYIAEALRHFQPGDLLLLQNEVSNVGFAIAEAKRLGLRVAFNASPINDALLTYPLDQVDYFLVNEVEGRALTGCGSQDNGEILASLRARFPRAAIVLTVGDQGVLYDDGTIRAAHPCYRVPVADTTAAGDTFCGYFLVGLAQNRPVEECLRDASLAAALAVSRNGASTSIPTRDEVRAFALTDPPVR